MAFASVAMLKHIFLVFVLAASFRNTVDAARRKQTKDANGEADDRLKHLITKFQTQNVIALTDLNFTKFVTLRPRDYVAVVMFTLANRHDCDICKATMPTFNEVASLYHLQYNFNSSEPKDRLAFFVVDADRAGRTFEELKLETVPRFYVLPPRSESDVKLKMSDFELSNRWLPILLFYYMVISAERMLSFI